MPRLVVSSLVVSALVVFALAAAMAGATAAVGWWGVPVVAALAALWPGRRGARRRVVTPARAALAGALAWGAFLAAAAAGGRLGAVLDLVGRVVGGPGAAVVALTVLLPALLAWAAAALAAELVGFLRPPAGDPPAPDPITLRAPGPTGRPVGGDPESAPESPVAATP